MPDASAMQSKVEVLDDEDNTRVRCCCTWNRQWSKGLLPLFWELLPSNLVSEFLSGKKILTIYLLEELEQLCGLCTAGLQHP